MLIGGMVEHQIHDDVDTPFAGFAHQAVKIRHGAIFGIDPAVIGNVVAKVLIGRGVDR